MSFSPQYLVAVNLVLLALAAYSASAIVGTAFASRLMPPPEVRLSPPPPPIPQEAVKPASHYALIHQRDIFNSAKPAPPQDDKPARLTPLKLKLWGVALYENNESYCIIENLKTRKQNLYRINDLVEGGATVKVVEWDRVVLTRNGQDEFLELEASKGARAKPAHASRRGRSRSAIVAAGSIQMTGENEFVIDRAEVDRALENMSQLFTQIRAVPHFEGGKATGFRLFAIRSGSLFDKIGLKNGDIIQTINGAEMNDPSRAMALIQELRDENDLTVELIRNRQPRTLAYQFR